MVGDDSADELATLLAISPQAIEEAIRRGLLSFTKHRRLPCWRFGDSCNGSFRRLDGQPFRIKDEFVKAEAETRGPSWHRLIGLDDVVQNDRCEVLLTPEGSKDALAAFHFAAVEGTLSRVGVVAGLGAAIKPLNDDIDKLRGRRVRIFADADPTGAEAAARIGRQFAAIAAEVQIFDLWNLRRSDGSRVEDLFDVTRIDADHLEANSDLSSITDLNSKGQRVRVITAKDEFFPSPIPPPHGSPGCPEFHGFPESRVYPVSNSEELEKKLAGLGKLNACQAHGTARKNRWKLVRDLSAVEKELSRKLTPSERMKAFDPWYHESEPHLDPKKTRDDYLAAFFAESGKVRVPTGGGEALKKALERTAILSAVALPELPGMPDAPESWRRIVALHRELARQSEDGTYFLSARDAAKAHPSLNKDSAYNINLALDSFGVIKLVKVGEAKPGGDASVFRYLLPL